MFNILIHLYNEIVFPYRKKNRYKCLDIKIFLSNTNSVKKIILKNILKIIIGNIKTQ